MARPRATSGPSKSPAQARRPRHHVTRGLRSRADGLRRLPRAATTHARLYRRRPDADPDKKMGRAGRPTDATRFPSRETAVDPTTGVRRRHHVTDRAFQRAIASAGRAAKNRQAREVGGGFCDPNFLTESGEARGPERQRRFWQKNRGRKMRSFGGVEPWTGPHRRRRGYANWRGDGTRRECAGPEIIWPARGARGRRGRGRGNGACGFGRRS